MNTTTPTIPRRTFLKQSAGLAATALAIDALAAPAIQSPGANEKVRVGFIGVGNRGSQLLRGFMAQSDCEIAALCDVYEPYVNRDRSQVDPEIIKSIGEGFVPKMMEQFDKSVTRHRDFRRLLEQKDVDAVVIATPDHWHAVQTILAFDAGKDVYVEKPLTINISEGRKMVQAQQRTRRVAQVGLHRRSSKLFGLIHDLIKQGKIGKVSLARAYRVSNMLPNGIGKYPDTTPAKGLDWDLWLGPRAMRPFRYSIAPYKFRWWQDYSSQMGNWGVHYCDAIRWVLDEEAPVAITAHGGKYVLDDDRTIPDTMEVTFEFASGRMLVFGQYEAGGSVALPSGEIEFCGTLGNLYPGAEANGYKIIPSNKGQFQASPSALKAEETPRIDGDLTHQHIRNFLDCVKSRQACNCTLEAGHRSTTFAHLANIALATRTRLEWDAKQERITNHEKANQVLDYEYRAPWKI